LTISVTNRTGTDLRGRLLVKVPVTPEGSGWCLATIGGSVICPGTTFVSGSYSWFSSYSSRPATPVVTYRSPLDLAAGTTKLLATDVLTGPETPVQAEVLGSSGDVLAKAGDRLSIENGTVQPAVAVVTGDPTALSSLSLPMPDGSQPQVQLLSPADVPTSSAALGAFSAVIVDQADTSVLSPSQARAVQGYVEAGGTLAVAGGLGWKAAVAGLPAGLLPARAAGTVPMALPRLARLLGEPPPGGPADVDRLEPSSGAVTVLSEGTSPLAVEASRGGGHVVVCAVDPAAAPLATWPGATALVGRLLAPAYQGNYYGSRPAAAPAAWPAAGPTAPTGTLSALTGPALAASALGQYLQQMPGTSYPSPALLGLLLLGYVAVAGPACFIVLGRLRRRELVWLVLPCIAATTGLAAYWTGTGMDRSPLADQVQVAQMAPGSNLAHVSSLGAVYLPRGGSSGVALAGSGPVADLGADARGNLTVGPGTAPGTSQLTISGPNNSLGGWAASEDVPLDGTVEASVREVGGTLSGRVTNRLGVALTGVYVVPANGAQPESIGALPAGGSARFHLSTSPSKTGVVALPAALPLSASHRTGLSASRYQAAVEGMYEMASEYSNAGATGPVLIGLASKPFLPRGTGASVVTARSTEAVVVTLSPPGAAGAGSPTVQPELVGSHGATGGNGARPVSLTLTKGGSFDYQFLVPTSHGPGGHVAGSRWGKLQLDLGSPSGSPASPVQGTGFSVVYNNSSSGAVSISSGYNPGSGPVSGLGATSQGGGTSSVHLDDFAVAAFDYETSTWETLEASVTSGHLTATIARPAAFLGPGGAVEVRLSALASRLEVFGSVPVLSAARP
jgi:hypothetical protein